MHTVTVALHMHDAVGLGVVYLYTFALLIFLVHLAHHYAFHFAEGVEVGLN